MSWLFENTEILVIAWILGWTIASLTYRKIQGKPIFYSRPSSVRFRQWKASGNSHRSWFTRLGGANGCLVVQITDSELDIHPFVPFNWFFLPEIYGLEYRISLEHVLSVKIIKKFLRKRVEVEFTTKGGIPEKISLLLKHPEDFLAAIDPLPGPEDQQSIKRGSVITAKPIHPGA